MEYTVRIQKDRKAGFWYVLSSGVPGLNVEGDTREDIESEIRELAPELLRENRGRSEFELGIVG